MKRAELNLGVDSCNKLQSWWLGSGMQFSALSHGVVATCACRCTHATPNLTHAHPATAASIENRRLTDRRTSTSDGSPTGEHRRSQAHDQRVRLRWSPSSRTRRQDFESATLSTHPASRARTHADLWGQSRGDFCHHIDPRHYIPAHPSRARTRCHTSPNTAHRPRPIPEPISPHS